MQTGPDNAAKLSSALRGLLTILLGGFVGALLGVALFLLWSRSLFNPWHALPEPPEPPVRLAGATVDTVTVESASGVLYAYNLNSPGDGWTRPDAARSESDEPCQHYAEKAPPLNRVIERRWACEDLSDAGVTTVYALRQDQRVWYWTRFDSGLGSLAVMLGLPVCGGVLGLFAGLALYVLRWRRRASSTQTLD